VRGHPRMITSCLRAHVLRVNNQYSHALLVLVLIAPADCAGARRTRGEAPDIVLPNQDVECVRHVALDIGGSLIKLAYFSPGDVDSDVTDASDSESSPARPASSAGSNGQYRNTIASESNALSPQPAAPQAASGPVKGPEMEAATLGMESALGSTSADASAAYAKGASRGGRLHFVKFETSRVDEAIDFIKGKKLHCVQSSNPTTRSGTVQVLICTVLSDDFAHAQRDRPCTVV
jgi:hypothetical protein